MLLGFVLPKARSAQRAVGAPPGHNPDVRTDSPEGRLGHERGPVTLASVEAVAALGLFAPGFQDEATTPLLTNEDLTIDDIERAMTLAAGAAASDGDIRLADLSDLDLTTLMSLETAGAAPDRAAEQADLMDLSIKELMSLGIGTPTRVAEPPDTGLTDVALEDLLRVEAAPTANGDGPGNLGLTALDLEQLMAMETGSATTDDQLAEVDLASLDLKELMTLEASGTTSDTEPTSDDESSETTGPGTPMASVDGGTAATGDDGTLSGSSGDGILIGGTTDGAKVIGDATTGETPTEPSTTTAPVANNNPVGAADIGATGEDAALTLDVLANDSDPDASDALSISGAAITTGSGTVAVVAGKLVYDPAGAYDHLAAGETKTVTVEYSIDDGNGGSASATATVTVTGTNDGPVAVADTGTTGEDAALTLDVLANDSDPDASDTLSISGAAITTGAGTVAVVAGKLVYDPAGAYDGLAAGETKTVTVEYSIDDGNGGTATSTATVTVTGTNDGPVAVADTGTTGEDAALTLDVLANDSDPDASDTLSISGAAITTGAGTVAVVAGKLVYDPAGAYDELAVGETRTVTVEYIIDDGNGGIATSTATVTVTGTNDGPVAVADTGTTAVDTPLTLDVLANDTDPDASDILVVSAFTQGANGTVELNPDDTITYTPDPGYTGTDTFTYTIDDGNGGTATETVTVEVAPDGVIRIGTAADETLTGTAGDDTLDGKQGDDILIGLGGADILIGSAGSDTADYSLSGAGVTVDIWLGTGSGGDAEGDILTDIENITGSDFDDFLTGTDAANVLDGGAGGDLLVGGGGADTVLGGTGDDTLTGDGGADVLVGGAGADSLDGGANIDTADYTGSTAAVKVDLTVGLGSSGDAAGDTLINIENVVGSDFDDTLRGDAGANVLVGGSGNDILDGGAWHDTLDGGLGSDTLTGGAGNDTFVLALGTGSDTDTIVDFTQGEDMLDVTALSPADFAALTVIDDGAGNTVVTAASGDSLVLLGVDAATLTLSDFIV